MSRRPAAASALNEDTTDEENASDEEFGEDDRAKRIRKPGEPPQLIDLPENLMQLVISYLDVLTVLKSTVQLSPNTGIWPNNGADVVLTKNSTLNQKVRAFEVPLLKLRALMTAHLKRRSEDRRAMAPAVDVEKGYLQSKFIHSMAQVLRSVDVIDWKQSGASFFFNLRFMGGFRPLMRRTQGMFTQSVEDGLIHLGIKIFHDMCTQSHSSSDVPLPVFVSRMPKPAENVECFTLRQLMHAVRAPKGKDSAEIGSGLLACIVFKDGIGPISGFQLDNEGSAKPEINDHIADETRGFPSSVYRRYFTFKSARIIYEFLPDGYLRSAGPEQHLSIIMEDCFVWTSQPGKGRGADFSQPTEDNGEFIGLPLRLEVWFGPPLSDDGWDEGGSFLISKPPETIFNLMLYVDNGVGPLQVLFRKVFVNNDVMQNRSCIFVNPDQLQSGQ
jgi:hypothetical protein